jgi:hypothetical protein
VSLSAVRFSVTTTPICVNSSKPRAVIFTE